MKYNDTPQLFADSSFDGLYMLYEALKTKNQENIALKDALLELKYNGLVGNYQYEEGQSFALGTTSTVCIKQGRLVVEN